MANNLLLYTLLTILVLFLAAGALTWSAMGRMKKQIGRLQESQAALQNDYDQTLAAWAKVLEYRGRETEDHSHELVELSTRLAHALGLGAEEITHLQRGAILHDIGKLAVPEEILLKPGTLNDVERKMMQQHPVFARQILSRVPSLQPSADVAYCHHERWDGRGYPQGLKGEEIPLTARMFTIVDQWDALTSDRPYRKAWSREKAIAYIQENAGKIYDPQIVGIFLTLI